MDKPYKRRVMWTRVAENRLVKLWYDKTVRAEGHRIKMQIFREISRELQDELGFTATPSEIKMKVNNLTTKYRREKEAMNSSGKRSQWSHFPQIRQIMLNSNVYHTNPLGNLPTNKHEDIKFQIEEEESMSVPKEEDFCEDEPSPSPYSLSKTSEMLTQPVPKSAANKSIDFQKDLLIRFNKSHERMEQHMAAMQEADRRIIALEMEKVALLRQQVRDGTELKNGVLKFLNEIDVVTSIT